MLENITPPCRFIPSFIFTPVETCEMSNIEPSTNSTFLLSHSLS